MMAFGEHLKWRGQRTGAEANSSPDTRKWDIGSLQRTSLTQPCTLSMARNLAGSVVQPVVQWPGPRTEQASTSWMDSSGSTTSRAGRWTGAGTRLPSVLPLLAETTPLAVEPGLLAFDLRLAGPNRLSGRGGIRCGRRPWPSEGLVQCGRFHQLLEQYIAELGEPRPTPWKRVGEARRPAEAANVRTYLFVSFHCSIPCT